MNPLMKILAGFITAGKTSWSVYDVASAAGVPTWEASGWIQSHFRAQRLDRVVVSREPLRGL